MGQFLIFHFLVVYSSNVLILKSGKSWFRHLHEHFLQQTFLPAFCFFYLGLGMVDFSIDGGEEIGDFGLFWKMEVIIISILAKYLSIY